VGQQCLRRPRVSSHDRANHKPAPEPVAERKPCSFDRIIQDDRLGLLD
jgi:hypothetical protein